MSFTDPTTGSPEPDHEEGSDQEISLHQLYNGGVDVPEGQATPEEERKSDHPTPDHITGRLEP